MRIRKIQFRQSGGFGGLVRGSEISEKDLSTAERRVLERYAQSAPRLSGKKMTRARDLVTYEIELDTDQGPVRIEFDESNVPEDFAPLMEKLAKRAKPVPP